MSTNSFKVTGDTGKAGPKGDAGLKGDTGLKGDKGDKGDKGAAGLKGDKGDKGNTGLTGTAGLKGDKGDAGTAGKGQKIVITTGTIRGGDKITPPAGFSAAHCTVIFTDGVYYPPDGYFIILQTVELKDSDLTTQVDYQIKMLDKNSQGVYAWRWVKRQKSHYTLIAVKDA